MAYSCVEVWFEIGHEASVRTKRTPEGFTHDWEVFVRGVDNADIHYFVEKVVFYLHETFPKPKRVVKEPPYSIKESGYAGFNLPIEVYFKNKDEPKKVQYNYDLQLQQSGPPITKIKREKYTFSNPSEDFRRKLIRGGGVGVLGSEAVGNSVSSEKNSSEEGIPSVQPSVKHSSLSVAGKPKLSSESTKKTKVKDAKIEDIKPSNSFADLFGPPIKTAKVSPDPKKTQNKVSPVSKDSKPIDKTDNVDKHYSGKAKHIPQKEIKKENASRDEKGEKKDKNKERERSKEKNSSSSSKHSTSPPKLAKEEAKKAPASDHKERVDTKNSDLKSDRKKEKKAKEEKVKKDKHKDVERGVTSERGEKSEKHAKESKEKEAKKSPKAISKETEKVREKEKHRDPEKDKLRHKHKKKEKEKYKKAKEENKEKAKKTEPKVEEKENGNTSEHRGEKRKRSESRSLSPSPGPSPVTPVSPEKPPERPPPFVKDKPTKNPLSQLFAELQDSFNSDSNSSPLSGDEDVIEFPKPKEKIFSPPEVKPEPIKEPPRVEEKVKEPPPETPEVSVENTKSSKQKQSSHRDKSSQSSSGSKSKSKEKSSRKKERDSGEITSEDTTEKKRKKRSKKGKETEDENEERRKESGETADSAGRQAVDNSSNYKHKFSKEYLSELLDLQKKIMTINDGEELQKVVHVLTQSGKYEINSKTFDVDLCALDKSTVKKLQEFFSAS